MRPARLPIFVARLHNDARYAFKVAADGATIIADDCTHRFPAVRAGWRKAIAGGFVADTFNKTLNLPPPGGQKGWCVGRFVGGRQRRTAVLGWCTAGKA